VSGQILPRSLDPLPGESLCGFVLRLAHRLGLTPFELAKLTGLEPAGHLVSSRLLSLDAAGSFARATRLDAGEAEELTLAPLAPNYPAAGLTYCGRTRTLAGLFVKENWITSAATRYCPACLAGDGSEIQDAHGGTWARTWRLPVVFGCTRHRSMLKLTCPSCRQPAHAKTGQGLLPAPAIADLHPAACRSRLGSARSCCGHRLDAARLDPLSDRHLDLQQHIENLLHADTEPCREPAAVSGPAQYFNDLRVLCCLIAASWPAAEAGCPDSAARDLISGHVETVRRMITAIRAGGRAAHDLEHYDRPPPDPAPCAALLSLADHLTRHPDPAERIEIVRRMIKAMPPTARTGMWLRQLRRDGHCSPQLTSTLNTALAPPPLQPHTPSRSVAFTVDHIPAFIPHDWLTSYFSHLTHIRTQIIRRSAALRLARITIGSSVQDAARAIGMPAGTARTAMIELGARRPALEAAVENLSAALDAQAPDLINYGQRRRALHNWTITPHNWAELTTDLITADTHRAYTDRPTDWGDHKRRTSSAWVWATLTGGEARHAPAFDPAPAHTQPLSLVGATSSYRFQLDHRDYGTYAALRARLTSYADTLAAAIEENGRAATPATADRSAMMER
jgi:hypothetical protein